MSEDHAPERGHAGSPHPRATVRVDAAAVSLVDRPTNGRADQRPPPPPSDEPPVESDTDYLAGLVAAAVDKQSRTLVIEVVRPDEKAALAEDGRPPLRVLFRFGVRMLDDREDDAARERHTANRGNDTLGRPVEDTDWTRYRCQVIYDATVDEGYQEEIDGKSVRVAGKELWRNQAAWKQVGDATGRRVINPVDFVHAVLLPEEKARFYQHIGDLSRVARGREVRRALNA